MVQFLKVPISGDKKNFENLKNSGHELFIFKTEKPCVCSRSDIFSKILMKLNQFVRLVEISDEFENGSWSGHKLGH